MSSDEDSADDDDGKNICSNLKFQKGTKYALFNSFVINKLP